MAVTLTLEVLVNDLLDAWFSDANHGNLDPYLSRIAAFLKRGAA